MKQLILIMFLSVIVFACGKKSIIPQTGYVQSYGTLIGVNERTCPEPSCGGLEITIKNDPTKNPSAVYLFNGTLPQLNIPNSYKYPIDVNLTWKRDTGLFGSYNYIVISQISIVK